MHKIRNTHKGLLNWRIPRPSMDSKHVRLIIWDFLYHPQNGTWTTRKKGGSYEFIYYAIQNMVSVPLVEYSIQPTQAILTLVGV